MDDAQGCGLRVDHHLVEALYRAVRDPGRLEPADPFRNRRRGENVGEDRDQRPAVDDAVAVGAEARILGKAGPIDCRA